MYDAYDALIFDMDGTLLDTESTHRKAWRQVLQRYNMRYEPEALIALNGAPTWRIAQVIIERHNVTLDPYSLAAEKGAAVREILFDEVTPLPLVDVVKRYYGKRPMSVGTGSEHAIAEALLQHLNLRQYFDFIVGADDVTQHKPEPETFLRCAELMGVKPEKCVVFEDADFGILAAQRAQMAFVDVRESLSK